ncbi:MAG: hypothetical protein Q8M92_11110, partial [Candidatus Subteraquimicrobiales bacterium]|nr:hypothetical protein [Candidatus Subteraquimicrobiales bacterium]
MRPHITIGDKTEEIPFIVTGFDLSTSRNAAVHNMANDFKVSSFGERVALRTIQGVLRNYETRVSDLIFFYNRVCISAQYSKPLWFGYQNYSGYGYIVGMSLSIQEGGMANVNITFLEVGYNTVASTPINSPTGRLTNDNYEPGSRCLYVVASADDADVYIPIVAVTMGWSSKYNIIDGRNNIVYYGENPVSINMSTHLMDEHGLYTLKMKTLLDAL